MNEQTNRITDEEWLRKLRYAYEQSNMFEELYLKYESKASELERKVEQLETKLKYANLVGNSYHDKLLEIQGD